MTRVDIVTVSLVVRNKTFFSFWWISLCPIGWRFIHVMKTDSMHVYSI